MFALVSYIVESTAAGAAQHIVLSAPDKDLAVILALPQPRPQSGKFDVADFADYLASALMSETDRHFDGIAVAAYVADEDGTPLHAPWPGQIFVDRFGDPVWPFSAGAMPAIDN